MRDLHLVGVQDDGEHLILAADDGTRFSLPIDEALRAAARRDRPRLGQLQIEIGGLRPREVQGLIRSGLSAEEVAERSGWTVEKVQRFETPILAEREHVAGLARQTRVGSGANAEETLGARVLDRLKARNVSRERVAWDSSRGEGGVWTVRLTFPAGGRQRSAQWRFDPKTRYLRALDDDARWLGEEESADAAIPTPHVATSTRAADTVYDLEVDGGLRHQPTHAVEDDLSDSVRALARGRGRGRRPTRSRTSPSRAPGADGPRTDALPIEELAVSFEELGPPPDRPRLRGEVSPRPTPEPEGSSPGATGNEAPEPAVGDSGADAEAPTGDSSRPAATEAIDPPNPAQAPDLSEGEPAPAEPDAAVAAAGEPTRSGAATADTGPQDRAPADAQEPTVPAERTAPAPSGQRKGRARVPSWDDIVFGTKPRGDT